MTADEAIAATREAFAKDLPMWPVRLVQFLDQPPSEERVFRWVVQCTRRLLVALEETDPKLEDQLRLFESYIAMATPPSTIRETIEQLWVQRSCTQTARTAVVQLFGALAYYRETDPRCHAACTVPIKMLVEEAPNPSELMELVLVDFSQFLSESGYATEPEQVSRVEGVGQLR